MKSKLSRRDFLKIFGLVSASTIAGTSGLVTYVATREPEPLEVTEVRIQLPRLSKSFSGYKIVQISDLHMGGWMNGERLQVVVDRVIEQKPDLVVITGDFFTGPVWDEKLVRAADEIAVVLPKLTADYLTLGVLGNHDYWSDAQQCRNALVRCGVTEVRNGVYTLERDGEQLHIAGVDDIWYEHDNLDEVLSKLPETGEAILLAHEPDFADISAKTGRFGLQLSGHSHGGQIVLPVIGSPWLPRLAQKYPSGLYRVGDMWQYTNRGVGMVDLSVRLNCPPEISVFILEPA